MRHIFSKPCQWRPAFGPGILHGRTMSYQAVAMEDTEIKETGESKFQRWQTDETKILIEAKKEVDLKKFEGMENLGISKTNFRTDWKAIETICNQKGMQRAANQCKSRWQRILLTYLQIKCWEQNITRTHTSFWSLTTDEKKATGVMLINLDRSIYNLLDEFFTNSRGFVGNVLTENADGAVDCVSENKLHAKNMQCPLKGVSEVLSMGLNTNTGHKHAKEQASVFTVYKNVSNHVNLTPTSTFKDGDIVSVSTQDVACDIENVLVNAAPSAEVGQFFRNTEMEVSSARMELTPRNQIQDVTGSTPSEDQACHSLVTSVEADTESPTWHAADEEALERTVATGDQICSDEKQSFEKFDAAVKCHTMWSSEVVSLPIATGEGSPVQEISMEACSQIQTENVSGSEILVSNVIEVQLAGAKERSVCLESSKFADYDDRHGMRVDLVESLHCGTSRGFLKHETDFTGSENSRKTTEIKSSSNDVGGLQENVSADSSAMASVEDLFIKDVGSTMPEISSTGHSQQLTVSVLLKNTSVETDQTSSEERSEDSHLLHSAGWQEIANAVKRDTVHSFGGVTEEPSRPSLEAKEMDTMLGDNLRVSSTAMLDEAKEMNNILEDNLRISLTATSVGQHGDADVLLKQEARCQVEVQEKLPISSAEHGVSSQRALGMMDGLSVTKEHDGHMCLVERMPTIAQQVTTCTESEVCQGQQIQGIGETTVISSETSETVNSTEKGLQLYDARKHDDVLMYIPAAIGNIVRSVSNTFKKLFKG